MGYRCYPNGEAFFDNVRVPKEYMLGRLNGGYALTGAVPWSPIEMQALYLGICKGIFKIALEHARQRVQGGKPIIEHPSVGMMLSEMAMMIDALEATLYDFAVSIKENIGDRGMKARFARIFPRDCFIKVMVLGMDVVASAGIMRDHPMEKLIRDGLTFGHGDGTTSLNKLRVIPFLKNMTSL
jgi:alkylation response protein AidB-like acyl-CoA dehydrogenase